MDNHQDKIINNTIIRFKFSQLKSNLIFLAIIFLIAGVLGFRDNIIYLIVYCFLVLMLYVIYSMIRKEVYMCDDFFITKPIIGKSTSIHSYDDIVKVVFNKSGFRGGSLLKFTYRSDGRIKTLTYNKSIMEPESEFEFLKSKSVECEILLKGNLEKQKNNYRS